MAGTQAHRHVKIAMSETLFSMDGEEMLARWGHLPPNETVDAAAIEPITGPSWILDLDMYTTDSCEFSVEKVVEDAERFSKRLYTFFRWAVTDEFLQRYGANT